MLLWKNRFLGCFSLLLFFSSQSIIMMVVMIKNHDFLFSFPIENEKEKHIQYIQHLRWTGFFFWFGRPIFNLVITEIKKKKKITITIQMEKKVFRKNLSKKIIIILHLFWIFCFNYIFYGNISLKQTKKTISTQTGIACVLFVSNFLRKQNELNHHSSGQWTFMVNITCLPKTRIIKIFLSLCTWYLSINNQPKKKHW